MNTETNGTTVRIPVLFKCWLKIDDVWSVPRGHCVIYQPLCALIFFICKMDPITYFIGLLWGLTELLIIQLEQYCTCEGAILFLHLKINGGLPLWPRAPWWRLQSSKAGDIDLNTGWGTKVLQVSRPKKKSVVAGLCQSWISDSYANSFCCFVCWYGPNRSRRY